MKILKFLILMFGLSVLCVGCKSVQPIGANTPSIVIKMPEHRSLGLGRSADFPAGVYSPDFQTDKGIYYLAPTILFRNALGMNFNFHGGLFIPNQNSSDQRQGQWDEQGGMLKFSEPIPYQIQY
jgi:hypothetical protein